MARILVTEKIADAGLEALRAAGHEVDVRIGLTPEELREAVPGAEALLIRSSTTVDAHVLAAGTDLVAVGRAGIGLDNVDVAEATRLGVMVVNAPQSNVISAAEHTVALLFALARNIPQAHAALTSGRWERSAWNGVEVYDKTLGILGLGRVGRLVAQRMLAFGMHLVAYDVFVSEERARQMSVELVSLEELLKVSDFITVHLPKTPETVGTIGPKELAMVKPTVRLVNTARGGIVDEQALVEALEQGLIAGAALDVFAEEPTTESPLFHMPNVVVTPHLGASTVEAQDKAGVTVAEQIQLALSGDFVPYAVNVAAAAASERLQPFLPLAERLGAFFAALAERLPSELEVSVEGPVAESDTSLVVLSVLKGLLAKVSTDPVSYVNAPQIARGLGVEVREVRTSTSPDYVNRVSVRGGGHDVAGTIATPGDQPRIVIVDGHALEMPPTPHMLLIRNDDVPGMIGVVGTLLGDLGINVSDMSLGRSARGDRALMLLAVDEPIPAQARSELEAHANINAVLTIDLG